jgi:hypothetical protein
MTESSKQSSKNNYRVALIELGWKALNERRLITKARLVCIRLVAPACGAYWGGRGNSDMNLDLPLPKTEYLQKIIGYRVPNYGTHFIS